MPTTVLTSRQFNHDTGRAKRAAREGPVFITHRGERSHVLLSIDEYERLAGGGKNLVELLAMPGAENVEFEPTGDRRPADRASRRSPGRSASGVDGRTGSPRL